MPFNRVCLPLAVVVLAGSASSAIRAQTPTPALLILNKTDATLVTVNPVTGAVLGKVATGEGPHEVVVSTDGKLAFVSNYGGNTPGSTISVIDLATQKELRRLDLSYIRRPHGLAFADGKLYFTAEVNRVVVRYDPATDKIDWLFGTGQTTTHMVMVNPEATRIVTANINANSMALFERSANNPLNWNLTVIPVGNGPEGFDISPDGKEIWAAHSNAQDGGVSIVDIATKKVTQRIDLKTRRSNRLKFTPDGKTVLVTDLDAGELLVVDVATKAITKHIPMGRMPEGILLQPDGARAYVAVNGDDFVAIVDLKSLTVTGKIAVGAGPDGMAWVPKR